MLHGEYCLLHIACCIVYVAWFVSHVAFECCIYCTVWLLGNDEAVPADRSQSRAEDGARPRLFRQLCATLRYCAALCNIVGAKAASGPSMMCSWSCGSRRSHRPRRKYARASIRRYLFT
jgi:hypothetical protein